MSKIADFEVTGEASIDPDQMVEDIDAILDKLDELAEKLDEIDAAIDEMSEKGIEIEVEIVGQDKLDELQAFLDELEDHEYVVNILINIDGEAELDELKLKLDELEGTPHEIDISLNDADLADDEAKLQALNAQLDETKKKMDSAKDSSDGFEFSLLMLAPALIPASAAVLSLVGGLGGIAAGAATAIPPLVLFGLSTKDVYTSITTLTAAFSTQTVAAAAAATNYGQMYKALKDTSTAFDDLSGPMKEVVVNYELMKNAWTSFQKAIQPEAIEALDTVFQTAVQILGYFTPAVKEAGYALNDVMSYFQDKLDDSTFQKFFKGMTDDTELFVNDFGVGIVNIVEGITAILTAFQPLALSMDGGFARMTQSFDTWAQKLGDSAGFKKFIATVETDGPKVLAVIGDIVRIIAHLVAALGEQSINTKIFDDLASVLGKIANFTGSDSGITGMTGDILLLGIAAAKLGPSLAPLLSFMATPEGAGVAALVAIGAGLVYAYTKSKSFHDYVNSNYGPMFKTLEGDATQFKTWMESIWPDIQKIWSMYGNNIKKFVTTDFNFIVATIGNAMKAIEGIIDIVLGLLTGNWSLVWKGIKTIFSSAWKEIVDAATTAAIELTQVFEAAWKMISKDVSNLWVEVKENFDRNMSGIEGDVQGGWDTITRDAEAWGKDFYNAIDAAIRAVMNFFGDFDGNVVKAFGDAGKILWNIGVDIINGLIGGIESMFGSVESTLSGLTNWITSWKGPPEKDKVLLNDAGASIIQGLIDGMESKYSGVESSLGGLTKTIGSKFGQQFTTDISAQVNASMKSVGANQGISGGASAASSGSGTVNVNAGAIQITNSVPEKASFSLTKLLQNGSKLGMLQAPVGSPQLPGSVSA